MASALFREIQSKKQKIEPDVKSQKRYLLRDYRELVIQEDSAGGVGGSVWDAALSLFEEIQDRGAAGELQGRRLVDLGAGTGVLGLCAAAHGAAEVLLTDRFDTVALLRFNSALNAEAAGGRVECRELEWGSGQEAGLRPPFDLVVASECIYNMRYAPALLETINALSGAATTVLFAYASRNQPEEERWFAEDVAKDWAVKSVQIPHSAPRGDEAGEKKTPPKVFLQEWKRKSI